MLIIQYDKYPLPIAITKLAKSSQCFFVYILVSISQQNICSMSNACLLVDMEMHVFNSNIHKTLCMVRYFGLS